MEKHRENREHAAYLDVDFKEMPDNIRIVYDYWHELRGDRFAPSWKEFDMMRIPSELLPSTLIKDVEQHPPAFRYRFYGSHFVRIWDKEMTGKLTSELESKLLAEAVQKALIKLVADKRPTFSMLRMTSEHKAEHLQIQLRLPLSNDGTNVTNIATLVWHLADKDQFAKLIPQAAP